jgi:adenosylmethionine-8-amino-7-oxononanoate aminotransferase
MFDLPESEILPLSLTHSFWTWSAQAQVSPIPVTKAKGVYFWDAQGKRYLDFNSMVMCVNIGHGNERVIEAIVQHRDLPLGLQWQRNCAPFWGKCSILLQAIQPVFIHLGGRQ